MPERTVTVASSVGLHARPASLFSQAAAKVGVPVTLTSAAGKSVNAASILGVLSLGIGHGEEVTLSAEGDGAEGALDSLAEVLHYRHDNAAALATEDRALALPAAVHLHDDLVQNRERTRQVASSHRVRRQCGEPCYRATARH